MNRYYKYLTHLQLLITVSLLTVTFWARDSSVYFFINSLSFIFLIILLISYRNTYIIPTHLAKFLLLSLFLATLYLIPIPLALWQVLPNRDILNITIQLINENHQTIKFLPISLDQYSSAKSLISLALPLSIFISTITLRTQKKYWLSYSIIGIVTIQALWGVFQFTTEGMATGSFYNRDHYSGLLELILPIIIALLLKSLKVESEYELLPWPRIYFLMILALLILLAGLFSLSRAGAGSFGIIIFFSILLFSRQLKFKSIIIIVLAFGCLLFVLGGEKGLTPLINRFFTHNPLEDVRWVMYEQALQTAQAYFPIGSGPGTFKYVYAAFQPHNTSISQQFVDHAHNDYLELIIETGLLGISIIIIYSALFTAQLIRVWRTKNSSEYYLKMGAAIGILGAYFHAFFDFNLHTLVYPLFFAYLNGVFFSTSSKSD